MVFQLPGADLGALQVLQNADGAIFVRSRAAQALNAARVIVVGAVGKVKPRDVHAKLHQLAKLGFGVARGTDGADDLRPPHWRNVGGAGNQRFIAHKSVNTL